MGSTYVSIFLAIASLPFPVLGITLNVPEATAVIKDKRLLGKSPQPTKGPSSVKLSKRLDSSNQNTCGWIDGTLGGVIECDATDACAFFTDSDKAGMVGCCATSTTGDCWDWHISCVNYGDLTSLCGSDCLNNDYITKCADSASPFCHTTTYPELNVRDFTCGETWADTTVTMRTAASGPRTSLEISPSFVPELWVKGWEATSKADTAGNLSNSGSTQSSTSSTITSNSSHTKGAAPAADSSDPISSSDSNSVPVGAIVGGVIGGLVVLGVIVFGAIYFILRYRRPRPDNPSELPPSSMAHSSTLISNYHNASAPLKYQAGFPPVEMDNNYQVHEIDSAYSGAQLHK